MNTHARAGFSLIEILVALAIIGVMLVVVVPNTLRYFGRGQETSAKANLKTIQVALETFYMDTSRYPETLSDLVNKPLDEDIAEDWKGPYTEKKALKDPWKRSYEYRVTPGGQNPYELYSYGKNGKGAPRSEWIDVWKL